MKKLIAVLFLALAFTAGIWAQQKYALVIGNENYTGISKLKNPVNDANDVEKALKELGFTVDKVLNGSIDQMEKALLNFQKKLKTSTNSYGFFFYAGHGVQANGENYLIPVDASGIEDESQLKRRALAIQAVLDNLNSAGNALNMIVLDACRDNPFTGWARSGSRGLSVISSAPPGCIIMYATSANSVAQDGTGKNGLFTGQLLKNLRTPGLSVNEIFNKTGADVLSVSGGKQYPEISIKFFEAASTYLGSKPVATPAPVALAPVFETGSVSIATGSLEISTITAGSVRISGGELNQTRELPAGGVLPVPKINVGRYQVTMRYADGKTEELTVEIGRDQSQKVEFSYKPAPAKTAKPAKTTKAATTKPATTTKPAAPTTATVTVAPTTPAPSTAEMIQIIQTPTYSYVEKLTALESMANSTTATSDSKSKVATAALAEGWRITVSDVRQREQLKMLRKNAMALIRSAGTAEDEVYPLLERSYQQYASSTMQGEGADQDECSLAIVTLRTLATEEAAKRLSKFVMDLNAKSQAGTITQKDERLIRDLIPALGATRQPAGRAALNAVIALGWTQAVKTLARDALKQIP